MSAEYTALLNYDFFSRVDVDSYTSKSRACASSFSEKGDDFLCMYKNKSLRLAFTQTHNGKHLFQTALPKMVIQASLKYQNVPEFVVETDLNC